MTGEKETNKIIIINATKRNNNSGNRRKNNYGVTTGDSRKQSAKTNIAADRYVTPLRV